MLQARTLKVLALILLGYGLAWAPVAFVSSYSESPMGLLLLAPLISVYVFHKLGVPGLLEHNGLCGWGWCSPTTFGWLFTGVFLLMAVWLVAWAVASVMRRAKR